MKRASILVLALLLLGTFSAFPLPHSFATSYNVTLKNDYPVGQCASGTSAWEYTNGSSLYKVAGSTSGTSVNIPSGNITFPIVGSGTSTSQCSASPLTNGLVGYWPLDEGTGNYAYDVSGNNKTGTLVNSPSWVTSCKFSGSCLNFSSSSSQYVSVPITSFTSSAFTITGWFNIPNGSTAVVSLFSISSSPDITLYPANNEVYLHACNGNDRYAVFTTAFNDAKWHFLAVSYSSSNANIIFELDGTQIAVPTNGATYGTSTTAIIGEDLCNIIYASAKFSNIRLYDSALSNSTLSELYSSTYPQVENHVTTSATFTTNFYNQTTSSVTSGHTYKSLGQTLTAGTTGTYWIDNPYTDIAVTLTLSLQNTGTALAGANYMGITYTSGGSSLTFHAVDGTNIFYADASTTISGTQSAGSNSTVRWCLTGCSNSANVGTGAYSATWDYWAQFYIPVSYTASGTVGGIFVSNPFFSYVQFGSTHSVVSLSQSPTSYWIDNTTVQTPQNPWYNNGYLFVPSPTSNTLSIKGTSVIFTYSDTSKNITNSCMGVEHTSTWWNVTQLWQNGCIAPAFVWYFADVITLPGFYAFLVAIIDVPILFKSRNFMLFSTIGLVIAGSLVTATNILSVQIQVLLWLSVALGTAFTFVRFWLGRQPS